MFRLSDALDRRSAPVARRCWKKERWPTRQAADEQVAWLLKRPNVFDKERVEVYACHFCDGFHVGRRRKP